MLRVNDPAHSVRGFTLIEIAFFIMALGMFQISGIKFYHFYMNNEHTRLTADHLAKAQSALNTYFQRNRAFPCPAARNAPLDGENEKNDKFGASMDCTVFDATDLGAAQAVGRNGKQVRIGALPVRELGLADDVSMDGWGNRLMYAVTEAYANPAAPVATMDQGAIYIQDSHNNDVTFAPGTVIFSVMAPGSDLRGVWNASGQQPVACDTSSLAGKNCNNTATFAATTLTSNDFTSTVAFRAGPPTVVPVIPVNGGCGAVMATVVTDPTNPPPPISDPSYIPILCGSGTPSAVTTLSPGTWQWTCNGSGGGSSPTCSLALPGANGQCGPADGTTVASAPAANLCTKGVASAVAGGAAGPWSWTCAGYFGGVSSPPCSATKTLLVVNGACGASNAVPSTTTPAGLCTAGASTAVTTVANTWTWSCTGLNGGTNAACSAPKVTNAVCGAASGVPSRFAPAAGLCFAGTPGAVGVLWGQWLWGCSGINGGSSLWCLAPPILDGVCGTANGTTVASVPTGAALCTTGTASAVVGSGNPWLWSCTGVNGGAASPPCTATKAICSATPYDGDLVILMDGSGSISPADWTSAQGFIKNLVANLGMTATSHVALTEFASRGGVISNLGMLDAGITNATNLRTKLNDYNWIKNVITGVDPNSNNMMNPALSGPPYRSAVYDAVVYKSPTYTNATLGTFNTMVDGLTPSAGLTDIYGGLLAAIGQVRSISAKPTKTILLITDGHQTVPLYDQVSGGVPGQANGLHYVAVARAAEALGIRVVTLGIKDATYNYNPWDLDYATTNQKGKNFYETSGGMAALAGVQAAVTGGICGPTTNGWKKVSVAGSNASVTVCGVKYDGTAWCWGSGGSGILGNGTTGNSAVPVPVTKTNPNAGAFWTDISVGGGGGGLACGLMSDGSAWCWGDNSSSQLGCYARASTGHTATCPTNDNYYTTPQRVMTPWNTNANNDPSSQRSGFDVVDTDTSWTAITPGYGNGKGYACGLTVSGHAWCWGNNNVGQLGDTTVATRKYPSLVIPQVSTNVSCGGAAGYVNNDYTGMPGFTANADDGPWNTIYAGGYGGVGTTTRPIATVGIMNFGQGRYWGNAIGVAGSCPQTVWPTNLVPPYTYTGPFRDLRAGSENDVPASSSLQPVTTICGVTKDGHAWCWGEGIEGQLGNNLQNLGFGVTKTPQVPTTPAGETATSWAVVTPAGSNFGSVCGLTTDGKAWCWGMNNNSQFGNGETYGTDANTYTIPKQATLSTANGSLTNNWVDIVGSGSGGANGQTTCGLTKDYQLWCWGNNAAGQMGNGTTTPGSSSPIRIP